MGHERVHLLKKIQEVEFAAVELQLFLDTHPQDQRALMEFNHYSRELMMLKQQFEMQYGPLLNFGFSPSQYPWRWIEGPWPWERQY
ncbi:spore coat protein CotJB [Alkaliphilus serpentinus]|uniref:Spore coat protein CotJB n=1 Tax=Alkaliphilus serpentinus TaxID=1482731 RepID=A0A833HMB6_9FIRM|nr:spore coat protein CotJB [Alkaliphilus serpentinus]KAB3527303.1 spore coat protein CotJB [Alkaliphilus serpentinus]